MNSNDIMYGENYPIIDIRETEEKIYLFVEAKANKCICQKCKAICGSKHYKHTRHIQIHLYITKKHG